MCGTGPSRDASHVENRLRAWLLVRSTNGPAWTAGGTTTEEVVMGQARETMDRITRAMTAGDRAALEQLYASDATGETPDLGRLEGGAAIADYLLAFKRAFPDASYESTSAFESGSTAIDEGYLVGTHTGPLASPGGDIPPTGKAVRLRSCDVLEVADGKGVSHRFFYDQLEVMTQLGLTAPDTIVLPDQAAGTARSPQPTS